MQRQQPEKDAAFARLSAALDWRPRLNIVTEASEAGTEFAKKLWGAQTLIVGVSHVHSTVVRPLAKWGSHSRIDLFWWPSPKFPPLATPMVVVIATSNVYNDPIFSTAFTMQTH